jgi:hypothetical protein
VGRNLIMSTMVDIPTPRPRPKKSSSNAEWRPSGPKLLDSGVLQLTATIALYSTLPVLFIRAFYIIDPDIWWHLRNGRWILDHAAVPVTDPFSVYGMDKPWVAYSWLFDTFIAAVHGRFGLVGVAAYEIAVRLALGIALFHLVHGLMPRFWRAAALTGVGLFTIMRVIGPRPGMLTILFLILELDILLSLRRKASPKLLWLLPPLFVVWANCHIEFVDGLIVLGLFAAEPLINGVLRYEPREKSGVAAEQVWLTLAASALATLANPYGWKLYSTVFLYMGQSKVFELIDELRAMTFREPQHFAGLFLLVGAAMAMGWRRDAKPLWLMLMLLASFMAFRMVREIWFLTVISLCVISDGWNFAPPEAGRPQSSGVRRQALVAVWVLAIIVASCQRYGLSNLLLEVQVAGTFPEGASRFIEQHHLPGPLLNDLSWGGFLIWRLPELPVAMDGRTNVHGEERILQNSALWRGKPGWSSNPELSRANLVLTPQDAAIAALLRTDPRFKVAYEDVQAAVFQRR